MIISDNTNDEQEDEPTVQLEEGHTNNENNFMDGDEEENDEYDGEK